MSGMSREPAIEAEAGALGQELIGLGTRAMAGWLSTRLDALAQA
jgi:hypothetical protein